MGRILDDQRGYYLIGFKPSENTFAGGRPDYHRIRIKVNVKGLRVRSRTGFFGIPDEAMRPVLGTQRNEMLAALASPFISSAIHVRLTGLYRDDPEPSVRFLMHVEPRDLAFQDAPGGAKKAVMDVLAVNFGDNGAGVSQLGRVITAEFSASQYELALKNGFSMRLDMPSPKPGGYQLRAVVRDESSHKVGSANCFVEVPDVPRSRLALSGVELGGTIPPIAGHPADARVVDPIGAASPAQRQFHAGGDFGYAYEIYDFEHSSKPRPLDLKTHLGIFRDGKAVYEGPSREIQQPAHPSLNRIFIQGTIHMDSGFPPGDYVVGVTVSENGGKKPRLASQWADFEVVP
jgi:hypothetical protein